MKEYIFTLAPEDAHTLAAVRDLPGLQAASDDLTVWLRITAPAAPQVWQLPAQQRYLLDEHNMLFPVGHVTPTRKLPARLPWVALTTFMPVAPPVSAMPGQLEEYEQYIPRLVAAAFDQEAAALAVPLEAWHQFVMTAPAVRLAPLRYAVSSQREVLIVGTPLPPIPGQACWMQHNMILPCGMDFEIPMIAELLARKYNADNDALLYFTADGHWRAIKRTHLIPASRSGVQRTVDLLQHE